MRKLTIISLVLIATRLVGDDAKDQNSPKPDNVESKTVVAEPVKVTAERVAPYVLLLDANIDCWRLIRAQNVGGDLATSGSGVIWADSGLWNFEIVRVSGKDVKGYSASAMTRAIFHDSSEALLIELKSRSGRTVVAEAYTHRGGWLTKK